MTSNTTTGRAYPHILKSVTLSGKTKKSIPGKDLLDKAPILQVSAQQLERYCKGVANHRRIEILMLVAREEGATLNTIAQLLNCNVKTVSEHIRRLASANLIRKVSLGRSVCHNLTPFGRDFYFFLKTFRRA
jgi:DNA-binding MarR family transcriptional regulator